jgi:hypothetical protein
MNPSVPLDDFAKRPMRYWSQDGLPDLMLGLMCLVTGVIHLIWESLPTDSSLVHVYSMVAPWVWMGCCIALLGSIKKLKERISFPRTGYVALQKTNWPRRVVFTAFFVPVIAALLLTMRQSERSYGPAVGFLIAAALAVGGIQYKLTHMVWLAVLSLLLGAWAYEASTGLAGGLWVMVGLGIAMALTGAWKLRSFLKAHPILKEPAE